MSSILDSFWLVGINLIIFLKVQSLYLKRKVFHSWIRLENTFFLRRKKNWGLGFGSGSVKTCEIFCEFLLLFFLHNLFIIINFCFAPIFKRLRGCLFNFNFFFFQMLNFDLFFCLEFYFNFFIFFGVYFGFFFLFWRGGGITKITNNTKHMLA